MRPNYKFSNMQDQKAECVVLNHNELDSLDKALISDKFYHKPILFNAINVTS